MFTMNRCYQFPKNVALIFYTFMIVFYWMVYNCCAEYNFVTEPQSLLVKEGETALLTCAWTPTLDDGHIVRWVIFPKFGTAFILEDSIPHHTLSNTLETSYLNISQFSTFDVGRYRCEVGDPDNLWISDDASVGEIACYPNDYDGELGETPRCYSSFSYVDLHWFRNGILWNTPPQSNYVLHSTTLTVEDDGSVFTCNAKYGQDSPIIGSCEITPLVLSIDARIEKSPPGLLALTDNFNLTCLVNGDPDKYNYAWTYNEKSVDVTTSGKRYALGDKNNILTFRDLTSGFNGKIVKCTVSRQDRETVVIPYEIMIEHNVQITTQTTIIKTVTANNGSGVSKGNQDPNKNSPTTMIVIGVVAITVIIVATIFIIYILSKKREEKYKNMKKPEVLPLEEPAYDKIKDNSNNVNVSVKNTENDPVRDKLLVDSMAYDELTISTSNTQLDDPDSVYAIPALPTGAKDVNDVRYDTPRKAVSLDHLDTPSGTTVHEGGETYAKPNKARSRESIDAMYAKPNKTRSKESIDDLYSKPNKSAGNTPKLERNKEKNVEGLTYADIEFQNGTYPSPAPKDYGLDYASVQFNS